MLTSSCRLKHFIKCRCSLNEAQSVLLTTRLHQTRDPPGPTRSAPTERECRVSISMDCVSACFQSISEWKKWLNDQLNEEIGLHFNQTTSAVQQWSCIAGAGRDTLSGWPVQWRLGFWMRPSYFSLTRWGVWISSRPWADRTRTFKKKYKDYWNTKADAGKTKPTEHKGGVITVPFVKFGVVVSFLHTRLFLGGLAFIWQQHEGDVGVHTVLIVWQQTPVCRKQILQSDIKLCTLMVPGALMVWGSDKQ